MVSKYTLSRKAEADLVNIFQYTNREFGAAQAESYLLAIEESLRLLANKPELASGATDIRRDYLSFAVKKHKVFFKIRPADIFIVRVLHQQMKYQLHLSS